jgi:integrase
MANDILREPTPESTPETKPSERKRRKIEPGIRQRGSRWVIDTFYRFHRLRESFATYEAAEANLRKLKTLIDEGRYMEKKREGRETLGGFRVKYLSWCQGKRQKAAHDKVNHTNRIVTFFGTDKMLGTIRRADVEAFQAALGSMNAEGKNEHTPLKAATINRHMATLKHLLSTAEAWEVIADNPARRVKLHKENNRRLRYLTHEELKALLVACPSSDLRAMVTLAVNTGMRKGEVFGLTRDSVNLRERFLELTDQKNGERGIIPLNETAISVLRSIPHRIDSPFIFPGKEKGKPYCDLYRQFEKAVKAAGLKGVTFHILRHTAASHLVMAGVDLATVKEIMRHKTIDMTLRYSHLAPAHKKAAVEALAKSLAGPVEDGEKVVKSA